MAVCERELKTEQNCNMSTPTLMATTAFLSRSPGLLNRCLGAQPLWDMFSFQHLLSNYNCSIGSLRAHSAGCWLSLLHIISNSSDLQLTDSLSSLGLYNNLTSTLLPASVTISHSFNTSTVKVIISWYSSTGCTCYLHKCISYFDSPAGSEVNIQQ